jgi:alkanesulfonate monooxygenase SsuD/methylene tetrahydromethanopterin reductase-like flavin-dependent oxidoreductase (luciferase family)
MIDWAKRAEAGGFSGLVTIDRIAYPSYDSLTALAAAAGATERISLMTNILLAPIYTPALLAKQAASIDQLSQGRLSLGLAAGGRSDDYEITGRDFHRRGREFDNGLEVMHKVWRGEALAPSSSPASPTPTRDQRIPILFGAPVRRPSNESSSGEQVGPRAAHDRLRPRRSPRASGAPGRRQVVRENLACPH